MADDSAVTRREFIAASGTVAAALIAGRGAWAAPSSPKRRVALVGTGIRGTTMWGKDIVARYSDVMEFVGLCDVNPLRVETGKRVLGVSCPTFTSLEPMLDAVKPDALIVTTVDATHSACITTALARGIQVITEKPMVTDEAQCRAVLAAEKKAGRPIIVTFNYRYAPKHQTIKETLLSGAIGKVTSVDFAWYLDTRHGADYFRRWHRLKEKSGSLWVHKATHHFDLVNWWLDAEPVEVQAFGSLSHYGKAGPFRHTNCRPCPHKANCPFYWDITKQPNLVDLYVKAEAADGYLRDGCVFKEDVNIPDTMNAIVKYSSGVTMSYSLNACMPIEGYRLAFNGTKGRLEVRDYERQPYEVPGESEIHVTKNFGTREMIEIPPAVGGHGGGDDRLRDLIFRGVEVPAHMRLPDSRAGAMSCLTGVAARQSMEQDRPIRIADLLGA